MILIMIVIIGVMRIPIVIIIVIMIIIVIIRRDHHGDDDMISVAIGIMTIILVVYSGATALTTAPTTGPWTPHGETARGEIRGAKSA